MGIRPFPTVREAFADVWTEESRKKLMMTDINTAPAIEASAL